MQHYEDLKSSVALQFGAVFPGHPVDKLDFRYGYLEEFRSWRLHQIGAWYLSGGSALTLQSLLFVFRSDEEAEACLRQHAAKLLETSSFTKEVSFEALTQTALSDGSTDLELLGPGARERISSAAALLASASDGVAAAFQPVNSPLPAIHAASILSQVGNTITKTFSGIAHQGTMPRAADRDKMAASAQAAIIAAESSLQRLLLHRQQTPTGAVWHPSVAKQFQDLRTVMLREGYGSIDMMQMTAQYDNLKTAVFSELKCAGCGAIPSERQAHKRCGGCKQVYYCSSQCQKRHWPEHKRVCNWK